MFGRASFQASIYSTARFWARINVTTYGWEIEIEKKTGFVENEKEMDEMWSRVSLSSSADFSEYCASGV